MFEIPLFAIFEILSQIRENSLIWSSLIWSTHCIESWRSGNFKIKHLAHIDIVIQLGRF